MNKLPHRTPYNQHLNRYNYPLQIHTPTTHYPVNQPPQQDKTKNDTLKVMESHQYSKLENNLNERLKNVLQNISICREKNHLKDREVQSNLTQIDKLQLKIKKLEERTAKKEKVLHKISLKCKEMSDAIAGEEEKVKKEMVHHHEEQNKCEQLEQQIQEMQKEIRLAQNQLERREKLTEQLQQKQEEQQRLREILSRLLSNEKMIEYQANNEKTECLEMENKVENLKKVWKDRTAINKSNASKLAKLKEEIQHLQTFLKNKQTSANQIKNMELELGELNQELLLINQDISELNFKILRKKQTVAQIRTKSEANRMQISTLTNQTPTFPSKELFSEQPAKPQSEDVPNQAQALKNIEKLINRYERIKSKDEQKY